MTADVDLELSLSSLEGVTTALAVKKKLEVIESVLNPGIWEVRWGGEIRKIFIGHDAHVKSTKWAGEFLEGKHGPL